MNIYDFFNSPDVAEYCRSIGHTFNALESAVMINQSSNKTLVEKHEAYKFIINEFPDMAIPKRNIRSVHDALKFLINYEKQLVEKLMTPEPNMVYQASICEKRFGTYTANSLFTSYEKALADVIDEDDDILYYTMKKLRLNSSEEYINAEISKSGEITWIENHTYKFDENDYNDEEEEKIRVVDCYIDVPVPFKHGDLVEMNNYNSSMGNLYVFEDIIRNNLELHNRLLYDNDTSDMTAYIYYQYNGFIHHDCVHFYPDMKYCKRELYGEELLLKYLSLYIKNEICVCDLLKLQELIAVDKVVNSIKSDCLLKNNLEPLNDKLINKYLLEK